MKFGLKEDTIRNIQNVFQAFPEVGEVILFGSRATGNYKNGSDIDLAIKGSITHTTLNKISLKLDELFLPYTIDLVVFNDIDNPDLLDSIRSEGIPFYKK